MSQKKSPIKAKQTKSAIEPDKSEQQTAPEPDAKDTKTEAKPKRRLTKQQLIALVSTLVVFLLASGALAYHVLHKPIKKTAVVVKKTEPPKPITKASPLTGVQVAPDLADRPITAVVIENHPDARPQSGLSQAGVVYEALAEGGITRFLAFFLDQQPKEIGPVRSLRTYFVDWALEFNAPVAHVGGNIDALDLIKPLHMKDMDQFAYGTYFTRSSDHFAPHNVYTTSDMLGKLEAKLGFNKPSDFTPSPRVKKEAPAATADHPNIHLNYSYNGYQVDYQYAVGTNDYGRLLAGQPHIDRNTGQQIRVKNIVVEYMPTTNSTTRIGEQTVIMKTPGSGQAIVFRDGTAIPGTWTKTSHDVRTKLTDANGNEIPLDPGNTWYSIIPVGNSVTY